ncbi:hypothetical protein F5B22DRAFT_609164 [Xylaria bambusicola]|uniref:uncharacterized protein n=1 Tax=Xylaria bambusicola TaxID=326684 RepID=UPI0020076B6B|nr:uncharacterized protein F5B22DRAFT_609164 [Xylaria bambusicola]KAI0514957.1 hypothetical protein F5B22DRAFT_609164 [Xylaria bambusicola]
MPFIASVVYPAGTKFDMEYYLAHHMPLVQKLWAPFGLKSWKVAKYDSEGAPYVVQAWLEWESKEHSNMGVTSDDGKIVFADVEKFSDKAPIMLTGEQVGSASW